MSETSPLPEVEFNFDAGVGSGWWPVHFLHKEGLSRMFETSVVLANRTSGAESSTLFEKKARVEVRRGGITRYFHGQIVRVEDLGTTGMYRFVRVLVRPALWQLSQRTNSRIWQHVNIAQVIRDVLQAAGIYQGDLLDIGGGVDGLAPHEYCVQYRETDLAFVQRLLEEEGVPYYFRHSAEGETWVLADDDHGYQEFDTLDGGPVSVLDAGITTAAAETVQWLDWHLQTKPTGVVLRDYDFTHPSAVLDMTPRGGAGGGARGLYDYPASFTLGEYDDGGHVYRPHQGARFARVRFEEATTLAKTGHGRGNVTGFLAGGAFQLQGHIDSERDRRHVLVEVEHHGVAWGDISDDIRYSDHIRDIFKALDIEALPQGNGGGGALNSEARYWNKFAIVPSDVKIRPERVTPRPLISGPQTAKVMAPNGQDEEIAVDFHGRVLCRFHWERPDQRQGGQRTENASCWIRVATAWAGAAWGTIFIPRVGMEVVVNFLEGDPDRPLITGTVYNAENNTPYLLPEERTKSTIKTSSSPGGRGFNELRFEDLADNEQIFMHAQRDKDVVVRRNETLTVGNDRAQTVMGNEVISITKDRTISVIENESRDVGKDWSIAVHGPTGMSTSVDNNFVLEAQKNISLKVGDSVITMTPDKITVSSKTVQILGDSLVRVTGGLVKINCDDGGADVAQGAASQVAPTLALQGQPGNLLQRLLDKLDPAKLADQAAKGLDKLLEKIGVPPKIRERLSSLAKTTVTELASALKEGRKPNFAKIGEEAITKGAQELVGAIFEPIKEIPAVKNSPLLSGLVNETQGVATTAVTYGTLHAVGLRDGLARDPFFQVLQQRHGESIRNFLTEQGTAAAQQVLNQWAEDEGLPPIVRRLARQASRQSERAIRQLVDRHVLPAPAAPAAQPGG
ncbi:MAG: type VI secretion system tip protein VgrG [Myxococcales bacterium]|nr:type VI secretion system tip protein VgrG [Myxococcales bacterium]